MSGKERYLSDDPAKRQRQLDNLKPAPAAPAANARARKHGGYSEALLADVEREVREVMDALAEAAPVRDADGSLPAADVAAVEVAARALRRYRTVAGWCDQYGRLDERTGAAKPAAALELETERALTRALDSLGMTPTSRSKLGVNLARTFDLAAHWAEQDAAAERAALADIDSTVEDPDG